MTKTKKILIGLILTSIWSCADSERHNKELKTENRISNKTVSSISYSDGHYKIDTTTILSNKNLQPLIDLLEKSNLSEIKNVTALPSFIKTFLDNLTDSFSIANPVENWQVGCVIDKPLPSRQFVYLGIGDQVALMTYYTGGFGKLEHVLIFKFSNNKILDFWCGNTMTDLMNKKEIVNYLKDNKNKEWGLNTNMIYF